MSEERSETALLRALNELLAVEIKKPITSAVIVPTTALATEIVDFASALI